MPVRTKSGKWRWGNVERDSKKELVQTVYGIWKKNGSKGSFSDFLKGTHESIELDETKVESGHLFFHGTRHQKDKLEKPETFKPFFVTKDLEYALSYAEYHKSSLNAPGIYLVKLNANAKVFDPTVPEDLDKLERLYFWEPDVLERLASGADVLMVMSYAAHSILSKNRESRMGQILRGASARDCRDYLCKQLKDLGYSMYKTEEDVDGFSSDLVYGVFDLDGLESLYPTAISLEKAKAVESLIKRGAPISEVLRKIEEDEDIH